MKRWSTTAPISTKRTTTSHLKSLNNKRSQYMVVEIQVMAWGMAHKCGCIKLVNGIPTLS